MRTRQAMGFLALTAAAWTVPISAGLIGSASGAGVTPPGTIYCYVGNVVQSFDGAGANEATLGSNTGNGRASRLLHGGQRWFLASRTVTGEDGPGPRTSRFDLFAVRADGAYSVRLTSEAAMEYPGGASADWAPDENAAGATVSLFARRWTGLAASDTVVPGSAGVYAAHLAFDGAGNVSGLDAAPAFFASVGTVSASGGENVDASGFSWSPDMTRLALDRHDGSAVRVLDIASGASTTVASASSANEGLTYGNWSPDGARIAYCRLTTDGSSVSLESVAPSGAGRTTTLVLVKAKKGYSAPMVSGPRWSPDSAYVVYRYVPPGGSPTYASRVSAAGTGNVNLINMNANGSVGPFDWR